MEQQQLEKENEERRQRRGDPRYVDVAAGASEQRRYLIQDERPELIAAYQSARFPDHIQITHVNAEGFTGTPEAASEVFAYLERWKGEREAAAADPAARRTQPNAVLERERLQQELGNVPQKNVPRKEETTKE